MTHDDSRAAAPPRAAGPSRHEDGLGPLPPDYAAAPLVSTDQQPAAATAPAAGKGGSRALREIVETLLLALIIFFAVRLVVLNFRVDGNSMFPNLHNREMLLVNRNAYFNFDVNRLRNLLPGDDRPDEEIVYLFGPPERGDIVVFTPPIDSDKPYIKRVIGLPGETVSFENGYVLIDGERLEEPYIDGAVTACNRRTCEPVEVPAEHVFVMGDNRQNSSDSRLFGPIAVDDIIGKAWFTYWPVDDVGLVPHYDYPEMDG